MLELQGTLNFSANINAEATEKQSFSICWSRAVCPADWDSFVISNAVRQLAGTMDKLGQSDEQRFLIAPNQPYSHWSLSPHSGQYNCRTIAQLPKSQDRVRARYLLASDLIEQQQEKALRAMDGLEQNYSVLAPYIALKRAQARSNQGQSKSSVSLGGLLKRYPDHPAAEALFVLGSNQPKYWKQAIAQFPTHPAPWKSFAPC